MRLLKLLLRLGSLCALTAVVRAQIPAGATVQVSLAPLNSPVPLAQPAASTMSPGELNETLAAARRAQELGLPALAAPLYRQLLAHAPVAERESLSLALTTALLDAGEAAEAQSVLATLPPPHGAAWHLRVGLAALQLRKRDAAQAEWNGIKTDEIAPGDRAWYYFFTGVLYDTATPQDMTRANDFYHRAHDAAVNDLAKARFQLAAEEARLRTTPTPTKADLEAARKSYEDYRGKAVGYSFARSYAILLDQDGHKAEAIALLQQVLFGLPATERYWRDELNLVVGLIGDATHAGPARSALNQLLESGSEPERQRQALQLLATASAQEPGRGQLRAELTKLLDAKSPHPIKESLLFYRAQLSLAAKSYASAEDDAETLLQNFPGSPLRVHAYGILTGSAWEQSRYRLAANHARQARAELATTIDPALIETRARLGVLEAEAWFRAGDADDYRNAADAYAAALRERPAGVPPGDLMFQRVLAEIKSGSANAAATLDELATDPAFETENRWQAEWNLARELQTRGADGIKQADERVNRLLDAPSAGAAAIKPELRARMAWLQARLSFEAGEFARTLTLADGLTKPAGELAPELREEIASTGALLKAQAQLDGLGDEAHGLETLEKLRHDFPKSAAAASSYLIEADYLAQPGRDRIVDAQKRLTKLADDFPNDAYAPYALYRAAVLTEKLGQNDNYLEANRLLVDLLKKYPQSDLVFPALLKEGEVLEKLNDLPSAQRIYQELENKYPRHRDVVLAQLALAKCLNAQASGNPSYLAAAQAKFEQLLDRVDAPPAVRVEAGCILGDVLVRRDNADKAIEVWGRDVVYEFLLKDPTMKARLLDGPPGVNGRYWMARTLASLGELFEKQGKLADAKRTWSLILETKLGYDAFARTRLSRFGGPETKL